MRAEHATPSLRRRPRSPCRIQAVGLGIARAHCARGGDPSSGRKDVRVDAEEVVGVVLLLDRPQAGGVGAVGVAGQRVGGLVGLAGEVGVGAALAVLGHLGRRRPAPRRCWRRCPRGPPSCRRRTTSTGRCARRRRCRRRRRG